MYPAWKTVSAFVQYGFVLHITVFIRV